MKTTSNKQLRRKLLCALVAGALAAPFAAPHAYALPIEGANAATNKTEADISTSGTVMDITGKTDHNILRWEDFSIEQNEKVRFDGGNQERDYLNLVTGEGASNIYGTIEGGRNVYLVNPHGILFAAGSQVNTGALYLSTANPADIATATNTFKTNGTSPLSATAQTGDVLNLGTVKASKLYIEGKNVKVLNTDDIQNTDGTALTGANVTIRSAETPHIGYDVGHKTTENIDVNGAATPYQVFDYASTNADHHKASASARGWDVANLGGTAHTDYDYMRVHDVYDLQNINAKRDGRYILAGNIDAGVTNTWNRTVYGIEGFLPIGENYATQFTGRFDGAGHTLRGLYINSLSATTLTTTGDIARKTLTLEGTAGTQFTKIYDGNATVTQNLVRGTNYRLAGVVEGEGTDIVALNESAAQGTYATANAQAAGTQQNVTFTNLALTGSGAGNYTLAANKTFENAGRITPKELNLALANGARFDKTYDGRANVTQSLTKGTNYSLTGFVGTEGDHLALAAATGTYTDKNAAANKAVTFGGLTLTGTGAGNYVLNKTALTGTGTIARRALTLGAVESQSKTYDGTTAADASKFRAALNNFIEGDNVTAAATTATFNDKNVAAANRIDYTGVALAGADAGNYTLAATTTQGVGSITHRDLTLTADAQSIVQGEALPSFTGRAEGFADSEDERVFGTDGITFGTTLTNTDTPGSYGVTGRIGSTSDGVLGNYRIGQAAGNANAFTIHAANLPGGLLASLVQDAAPRFDMGFGQEVYVFGLPRPIRALTLGFYRFDAERDLEIQGLRL